MAKHKSDVHLKKEQGTTGLTLHALKESHDFDFENVTILEQIPNYWQRLIAENMYIHKTSNTVNTQVDKDGLHSSYANLMKLLNSKSDTSHRPKCVNTAQTVQNSNTTNP